MSKTIFEDEFERQDLLSAFVNEMDERGYVPWFIGEKLAEIINALENMPEA